MRMTHACSLLTLFLILGMVAVGLGGYLYDRNPADRADLAPAESPEIETTRCYHNAIDDLPAPVKKYLRYAVLDGRPEISSVGMTLAGRYRTGEGRPWQPLEAEQQCTTSEPGLVWQSRMKASPLVWGSSQNVSFSKAGGMLSKAVAIVPAFRVETGETDRSLLARYLCEAVWYPTVLLAGGMVEWEPIDDRSAEAVITSGGVEARAVFHFNEIGQVVRVETLDRCRESGGGYCATKWTGEMKDYIEIDGVRIPSRTSAVWRLAEGDLHYLDLQVVGVDYNPQAY